MKDIDFARSPADAYLVPDFQGSRSWKEQPIDVRADAAAQVRSQRRGQIEARRTEELREERRRACGPACADEPGQLLTPEVRRIRRADPYYPSRWVLWKGEKGRAYVRAWNSYSWGLGPRPNAYAEFENPSRNERRRKRLSNPLMKLKRGS